MALMIDLSEDAEKAVGALLVEAAFEIGPRPLTTLSRLETLGVVAVRMLVQSKAIDFDKLCQRALTYAAEDEEIGARGIAGIGPALKHIYSDPNESLKEIGITFHTRQ